MTIFRSDYQPYPYDIPKVDLTIDLDAEQTRVVCVLQVRLRENQTPGTALVLNGEDIELVKVLVDEQTLPARQISITEDALTLTDLPSSCSVTIESTNCPKNNGALMGLYVSGSSLFTQCEAEGFRRITYFADRPDVMSIYNVTLRGKKSLYPLLLSNGNLIRQSELDHGRHECHWHDPFPKPCYLFALVAGRFDCRELRTQTQSGREVTLQIYSDPGTRAQTDWAMQSLVRAMRWDEQRFGLELDLDRFMVVVARDFNMGAMENKGLNIFNAAYVLADQQTSTDANYQAIEAVVGHEYFHNWTGNRVTCRDWFQLSLKEGLTVFRDQEFTADMLAHGLEDRLAASARAVKRIDDVAVLRAAQFPEDAGPMAHPIRPESYQEIGNFYTATVYEKGAEVIRMLHTLLGETTFQQGMREYFRRHDGQAVTCDDFVSSMQWAWQQHDPQRDLEVFKRWYNQAGTPQIKVQIAPSSNDTTSLITITQSCEAVGVEKESGLKKLPFHIPMRIGGLDAEGKARELSVGGQVGESLLLELTASEQTWEVQGLRSTDILSVNRGFTSPVQVAVGYSNAQLATLARHDSDAFARWEALQSLFMRHILDQKDVFGQAVSVSLLVDVCSALLTDQALDAGYLARLLALPSDKYLLQQMSPMDPLSLAKKRQSLEATLGRELQSGLIDLIQQLKPPVEFDLSPLAAGKRSLRNLALSWLCQAGLNSAKQLAYKQLTDANNMTDRLGALRALVWFDCRDDVVKASLQDFYEQFKDEALVVDKWFTLQATAPGTGVSEILQLIEHPAFNARNPNRLRALVFQFCLNNPLGFHQTDGQGYDFWSSQVIKLDQQNPEVASRLARALDHWAHHAQPWKSLMHQALTTVANCPNLSDNTKEIVSKALTL